MIKNLQVLIDKHLQKTSYCWFWSGSKVIPPIITNNKKNYLVRKVLYEFYKKKSSKEYLIAICKNKECVNPEHIKNREELIEAKINKSIYGTCWIWTGLTHEGYGYVKYKGKNWSLHRLMYCKYKGDIPIGMNVCHSCDNPRCCNPDHLWLGKQKDNIYDCVNKKRDNKPKGENHLKAKVTYEQAKEIKLKYKNGIKPTVICRLMNLPYSTVYKICINENWKHIIV